MGFEGLENSKPFIVWTTEVVPKSDPFRLRVQNLDPELDPFIYRDVYEVSNLIFHRSEPPDRQITKPIYILIHKIDVPLSHLELNFTKSWGHQSINQHRTCEWHIIRTLEETFTLRSFEFYNCSIPWSLKNFLWVPYFFLFSFFFQ